MRWSCSDVSGWTEERIGVEFVDMLKPKGRVSAYQQAYVASKMRPHPLTELLPPQMPVWAGLQSVEE